MTLPGKLLISTYRPKMYVTTLRPFAGRGTAQTALKGNTIALKGNTIAFPQDIVKVAETLPANPNILIDHIKVVFIGNGNPSREALKKIFTVRREKVYGALTFLIENHQLYVNVSLSTVNLPVDDVPDEILNTLVTHEDPNGEDGKEHANYTPQTDFTLDVTPSSNESDSIVMNSSGIVDINGDSVHSSDQLVSAVHSLQGTMIVPHGSNPVNDYNNPALWIGAYPWLFPYGKGGPEMKRTPSVSLKLYIRHLLLVANRKFCQDSSFKFHIFNVLQKRDVSLHTSLLVQRPAFHSTATDIDKVSHQDLVQVMESVEKKTPITDPNLKKLMKSLTSAGAHIRSSPYCKQGYRREIFGLMIKFGTPPLWITISNKPCSYPLPNLSSLSWS